MFSHTLRERGKKARKKAKRVKRGRGCASLKDLEESDRRSIHELLKDICSEKDRSTDGIKLPPKFRQPLRRMVLEETHASNPAFQVALNENLVELF